MKVIAFDPGYDRLGIAGLEGSPSKPLLVFSECFQPQKKDFHERLRLIGTKAREIALQWKPDVIALETLLFSTNQKTAMRVAEVRGVLAFIACELHIPVLEYNPMTIKAAAGGHGRAAKDDVRRMVERLVQLPDRSMLDDEIDAIAVGITCIAHDAKNFLKTVSL